MVDAIPSAVRPRRRLRTARERRPLGRRGSTDVLQCATNGDGIATAEMRKCRKPFSTGTFASARADARQKVPDEKKEEFKFRAGSASKNDPMHVRPRFVYATLAWIPNFSIKDASPGEGAQRCRTTSASIPLQKLHSPNRDPEDRSRE